MAKASILDEDIREKISNLICIRLMKNLQIYYKNRSVIYLAKIKETQIPPDIYTNYASYKEYEKDLYDMYLRHIDNNIRLGEFMVVLLCSEYILHRLGFSCKIKEYLDMLQRDFATNELMLNEFIKQYHVFKTSLECQSLIKTYKNILLKEYGLE